MKTHIGRTARVLLNTNLNIEIYYNIIMWRAHGFCQGGVFAGEVKKERQDIPI